MKEKKIFNQEFLKEKSDLDHKLANKKIDQEKYEQQMNLLFEKDQQKTKELSSLFSTIGYYYKTFWKFSLPMIFLALLSSATSILLPLLTQQMSFGVNKTLIERAIAEGIPNIGPYVQPDQYWGLEWYVSLAIAAGITVANLILMFFSQFIAYLLGNKIEIQLRQKSLESLVNQDVSYYSDKKIGEILTKVISDTQIVGEQSVQIPITLIQAIFTTFGTLGIMFYFEWRLSLVVIGVFVILLVFMGIMFTVIKTSFQKVREVVTDINGRVTDRINNIRLVKSSGTEKYEKENFVEVHKEFYEKNKKMAKVSGFSTSVLFGGISLLQLAIVGTSMILYANGDINKGIEFFSSTFASFTLAQSVIVGSLFQVIMVSVGIARASVATLRIEQIIKAKSKVNPNEEKGTVINNINGDIIFKDVEFSYPEKPEKVILPKFSFKFEHGKSYAFVGETGAGKSTISKLLLRYYDPTHGKILINNKDDLRKVNLPSYLSHVGYVEQEPSILYGTVYDNVKYSRFDASDEEVVEACKKAELHELIEGWTDGYNTILGERGMLLSGGQKQRLVIARMFLKDPDLLILDEATSSLDNIIEKEIQKNLENLMKGRTTISIAHRLSTIKNADQIIVLGANGAGIVQTGTFDGLKNKPGHFKKLYQAGLMD